MSRRLLCALSLALAVPLAGCTAPEKPAPPPVPDGGAMRLVSFDSCAQLFADLRKAAKDSVGPWGLPGADQPPNAFRGGEARTMAGAAADSTSQAAAPRYSGTNVHEQGADEPDLIKTDGRRIVTVSGGTLHVIDAATRRETGRIELGLPGAGEELLLTGDSALVLVRGGHNWRASSEIAGPQVLLVNLTGKPSVVSRYRGEGTLVDARMTGSTARIVLRSTPRITFPLEDRAGRIADNRKAIDDAPDTAWLPRWEVSDRDGTTEGSMDCARVSRPTDYSGGSLVSILTFDLTRPTLGSGDPVAVVADGRTVYGTADSLYLAGDERWRYDRFPGRAAAPVRPETQVFKFAVTGSRPPVFRASGTVPGHLLNQYALSEWDGHLRVATTDPATDRSAVRVLADRDGRLVQTGIADGLGQGERIYSVRFIGARGYVVTFKQTDPLYSLDLSDPTRPAVTGELKITGYSAHLQPVGENRLVGIGQEADTDGRTRGMQVSLFDVEDPANPKRLARYHLPGASSHAEYDPHGLLWWPATQLLVVPVEPGGSVALRVTDDLTPTARPDQPVVLRSLVVGDDLWTLSKTDLRAASLSTMDKLAQLPLGS